MHEQISEATMVRVAGVPSELDLVALKLKRLPMELHLGKSDLLVLEIDYKLKEEGLRDKKSVQNMVKYKEGNYGATLMKQSGRPNSKSLG